MKFTALVCLLIALFGLSLGLKHGKHKNLTNFKEEYHFQVSSQMFVVRLLVLKDGVWPALQNLLITKTEIFAKNSFMADVTVTQTDLIL